MAKVGTIIEINGKKYDAVTGRLLKSETQSKQPAAKNTPGVSVDGMMSRKGVKAVKQTQRSKTLMRTVVKKPSANPTKMQASGSLIVKSQLGVNKSRQAVAQQVKKSPHISHFDERTTVSRAVIKKIGHVPVKQPIAPTPQKSQISPRKTATNHSTNAVPSRRNVAAAKMIETALARANAHEQPYVEKTKRRHSIARRLGVSARAITISSTVLAGVLLGGFFAVQNVPNVSMRVAAARAGFDASLPNYSPSGFSFRGPIQYSPGQVTISFQSNTDDRRYSMTQRPSNWNSEALLANFVAIGDQEYQKYEDRGRTLFIYGNANATWVDNGIWYQVEGNSGMSTDQIIRLAASM